MIYVRIQTFANPFSYWYVISIAFSVLLHSLKGKQIDVEHIFSSNLNFNFKSDEKSIRWDFHKDHRLLIPSHLHKYDFFISHI